MAQDVIELVVRAGAVLEAVRFAPISAASAEVYTRVATALERAAASPDFAGPAHGAGSRNTASVRRAAWRRLSHREVALAVEGLRSGSVPVADAVDALRVWVPRAEGQDAGAGEVGWPLPTASKRDGIHDLPPDWMDEMWSAAVSRGFRHLDGLAVLTCTGARAVEVCAGAGLLLHGEVLDVALWGAKVREDVGQPWRRLSVALDHPASVHLAAVVSGGRDRVRADCTPNALSMAVADLAGDRWGRRVSAIDYRHQRAADAKGAFGDRDAVARWLGHAAVGTARHYGKPRGPGQGRGPTPLAADAPRAVRRHAVRRAAIEPAPGNVPASAR